ncbi:MAG: hypothetical protein SWX82_32335 [Cyanobacteriota bacterium]|nr:hypothetical protein [Cyanobacteriota bacterium]
MEVEIADKEKLPKPSVKLSVASLGPSGVGKTSILAVINKYFRGDVTRTDFKVFIDQESHTTIKEHEEGLEDLVKDFDAVDRGLQSTEDEKNINFILRRDKWRSRDTLGLEFLDISGGWLQKDPSSQYYQKYFNQVINSGAVIIPIDTLALMQEDGKYHQQLNDPQSVTKMIATAYDNLPKDEERLVLFIPVKCETYVKTEKNMERLVKDVRKGYAELIYNVLRPKANVAVVITPIQTVGCVVCGGPDIDIETGELKGWLLNKTRFDAPMESQWEDQPLRYIMRFLIHQYMKQQRTGLFGRAFYTCNDLLKANNDLYEALRRFAQGRIKVPPFEVIQGHDLLNI